MDGCVGRCVVVGWIDGQMCPQEGGCSVDVCMRMSVGRWGLGGCIHGFVGRWLVVGLIHGWMFQ